MITTCFCLINNGENRGIGWLQFINCYIEEIIMKNTFSSLAAVALTMFLSSGAANANTISMSDWNENNHSTSTDSNKDGNPCWSDVCAHQTDSGKNETHVENTGTTPPCVSPVPEPQTYAMMLAGLGLIGFSARRKMNT
jgi:hypothetical protein